MITPLEQTILRELFTTNDFAERVVPYLKKEYWVTPEASLIYTEYYKFFNQYHAVPQLNAIRIELDASRDVTEQQNKNAQLLLDTLESIAPVSESQHEWLLKQTEEFCQDRAIYVALQQAIQVMDDKKSSRHTIPELMKEALAVTFDSHVGHDFFEDAERRYEMYHDHQERIPFDVELLNTWTRGGVTRKTLNVVAAGTNSGKSLFLVHQAATSLRNNKNVLYITLEMAEERIAERIDANMMNLMIDDVVTMPKDSYLKKINFLKSTSTGRLIIKEYPTSSAHVGHFRALLNELRLKRNFIPDVIFIDYLTICASTRNSKGGDLYLDNKYKAEEIRSLAVEFNVPIWTGAQLTREGFDMSAPTIKQLAESFAIAHTADFMFALASSDQLRELGQVAIFALKNRYAKRQDANPQDILGMDTGRMRIYDLASKSVISPSVAITTSIMAPSDANNFSSTRNRRKIHLNIDSNT